MHFLQPTVGEACERYHELPLQTHGLYLTLSDKGHILDKLRSWPVQDVRVAVITDGERILGLGEWQGVAGGGGKGAWKEGCWVSGRSSSGRGWGVWSRAWKWGLGPG